MPEHGVEGNCGHVSPPFPPQLPLLTSASAAASWSTRSRLKTSTTACRGTRAAASPGTTAAASGPMVAAPSSSCGSRALRARRYLPDSPRPPGDARGNVAPHVPPHPTYSPQECLFFLCRTRPSDPILLQALVITGHLIIVIYINIIIIIIRLG